MCILLVIFLSSRLNFQKEKKKNPQRLSFLVYIISNVLSVSTRAMGFFFFFFFSCIVHRINISCYYNRFDWSYFIIVVPFFYITFFFLFLFYFIFVTPFSSPTPCHNNMTQGIHLIWTRDRETNQKNLLYIVSLPITTFIVCELKHNISDLWQT